MEFLTDEEDDEQIWEFKKPGPQRAAPHVRLGIDFGKKIDPSAVVVVEVVEKVIHRTEHERWDQRTGEFVPLRRQYAFVVRHIERIELGTSYPAVCTRIAQIVQGLNQKFAAHENFRPHLFCDQTGLGGPIVDLLRQHLLGSSYTLTGVSIASGAKLSRGGRRDELVVGKAHLVSRAQSLLEQGLVKLPKNAEAEALAEELRDFEVTTSDSGALISGARSGKHDDMVVSLALALLIPVGPRRRLVDVADL